MLDFKEELAKLSLNKENSVVIGSGILNALGLKESHDVDVVVDKETLLELLRNYNVIETTNEYGAILYTNGIVEFSDRWYMDDFMKDLTYEDLIKQTTIIDGVRYIELDVLLKVKEHLRREKDIPDIELIKEYLNR
ncbi:MAG: hypothetical protein ACOX0R_01300 [Candidatus Dojkabacteria bacterium]|jgi:hypothetical protein